MCYYLKTQYYTDPLFKEVDATYIIHLESDTSRQINIDNQLKLFHPTKTVHILYNKGFKKCYKPNVSITVEDLIHCYLYICNDAKKYNTILILEDDFIFNKEIKNHTKNIDTFIKNHNNFVYRLGCIPAIQVPYNSYTNIGIGLGTHAVLYSKTIRNKIINKDKILDWDKLLNNEYVNYIYYKPLCYQLFPNTENRSKWGITNNYFLYYIMQNIVVQLFKLLKLDTQTEPGYSILYSISLSLPFIILLLILFLIKKIY